MKSQSWMTRLVAVLGIAAFLFASPARGQECPKHVGDLWGGLWEDAPDQIEVSGPFAYLGSPKDCYPKPPGCLPSTIGIADVSVPEESRFISFLKVGALLDFIVSGSRLYHHSRFDDGWGREEYDYLGIIDVSDPSHPVTVMSAYQIDGLHRIAVSGDRVFAATSSGLMVLDASDPSNPVEVGFHAFPWSPSDLVVEGEFAFIAVPDSGMSIIDVSDPANPVEIGSWTMTWEALDLEVQDGFAYVADGAGGLRVIDATNPAMPTEIGVLATEHEASKVSVWDSRATVVLGDAGVLIVDVSNPANPEMVGVFATEGAAFAAALSGTTAYISEGDSDSFPNGQFQVVDLAHPGSPVERAAFSYQSTAMDVAVSGDIRFVASGDAGLLAMKAYRRPDLPIKEYFDTPGFASGVTLHDRFALVADDHKGLRIIDVANPLNMTEVGFVDTPGRARRVVAWGDHAYVADGYGGLRVIDISSPSDPKEVGFLNTDGNAADLAVAGEYVYLADGPGGLRIIDVSDPTLPTDVTPDSLSVLTGVRSVEVTHDRAFTASTNGTLNVLDISNRASPRLLREEGELRGFPTDIALLGIHIFVSTRSNFGSGVDGVDVFETSYPEHRIRRVGAWDSPEGIVSGVAASKGQAWVAAGGLRVFALETSCLITYWVELVAHQSGLDGSGWRSDVIIGSPWDRCRGGCPDIELEFNLHTPDGIKTSAAAVGWGVTGVFEDIVGILGYEGKGALEIRTGIPVSVSSRTYNQTESGTTGGSYPGYRNIDCLDDQHIGWLYGLRQVEGEYRTNISITNITDEVRWVWIVLHEAGGRLLGFNRVNVDPGMTVQNSQPFARQVNRPNLGWGMASVWSEKGGILTSATVIDERTNDAVVVPMVIQEIPPSSAAKKFEPRIEGADRRRSE